MPPLYRLVEVGIYSLLNFLPLMVLALYPFRHRLRFSKTATVGLVVALSLVQIFLGWQAAFFSTNAGLLSAVSTLLYAAFYFFAVGEVLTHDTDNLTCLEPRNGSLYGSDNLG